MHCSFHGGVRMAPVRNMRPISATRIYRNWWIGQAKGLLATGYKGLWIDDVNLVMRVGDG